MRETKSDGIFNVANTLFLLLLMLVILYPLVYIVSASISDPNLVGSGKMWLLPKGITFEGYERALQNQEIWMGYRNTLLYTVCGVSINLFVTLLCAYALSDKDLLGRNAVTFMIVFTMFFSGGLIPTYLLVKQLGMVNTVWALLIPNAASAMNIIVARTFFQSNVPPTLKEAAEIDGCSEIGLFLRIVMPISKPIVAVMALYYGVGHWNQYFNALLYISDRDLFPIQLILREILVLNEMSSQLMQTTDNLEAALEQARISNLMKYVIMIISALPMLIIYPFLQRYFVKGMLIGSIKE